MGRIVRYILSIIGTIAVVSGIVYAYVALTGTGQVTVIENLSWVGENTFDVSLMPQESVTESLTIANASSIDMEIDVTYAIDPDPGSKGMSITIPNKITVPGSGNTSFNVSIVAGKGAEPITYTVTFEVAR